MTKQMGRCARSVYEVAKELGSDWHTVNEAVLGHGQTLFEDPERFGVVEALGLDEVGACFPIHDGGDLTQPTTQ